MTDQEANPSWRQWMPILVFGTTAWVSGVLFGVGIGLDLPVSSEWRDSWSESFYSTSLLVAFAPGVASFWLTAFRSMRG